MRALDSLAAIALWGPTRVSRNREVLWSVLTPGHRVAPSWRAQYQRSQLARATWTAARAHEHRIRTDPRCPHCGAPAETDEHMLWACPSWEPAQAAWRPSVEAAARPLPTLAVPSAWPACLRSAGLLPLALVPDNDAM